MTATQNQAIPLNGFRWMEGDAYLFDIDGTLLVTRDLVHRNALHHAMREVYGVDTTIDGIAYQGKTDLGILRAALERMGISGEVFEAKLPDALNVVCLDVAAHANRIVANVCDGIPEVLARLKAAGKLLGVASGNLEAVGWHKIKAAGLREFFSFGCFSDHCEMRVDIFRQGVDEARADLARMLSPASLATRRKISGQLEAWARKWSRSAPVSLRMMNWLAMRRMPASVHAWNCWQVDPSSD